MSNATSDLPKRMVNNTPIHQEPAPRTWSGFTAIAVVVLIFLAALYGGALLLGLYVDLHHWSKAYLQDWLQNSVESQFLYVLFNEIIIVFLLWAFIRWRRYKNVRNILGLLRPQLKDLGYVCGGVAAYFLLYFAAVRIVGAFTSINLEQQQDVGFQTVIGSHDLVLTFISLVILPPLVEELLFRGFLFGGLRRTLRFGTTAVITSVLFAIPHLLGGRSGEGLLWIAGLDTLVLSFVLCYLREKTGRLWAGAGLHALKNGIAFWALFIYK